MEEKERYEIHIYDDICVDLYDNGVLDKSINDTYKLEKLLNQQDKENKKLRNIVDSIDKLKQYSSNVDNYLLINPKNCYCKDFTLDEFIRLQQENQQLNKQLHDLPKKE